MRTRGQVVVRIALAIAGLAIAWPACAATVSYTVDGVAAQQFPGPVTPPSNAPWGTDGYPGDTVEVQTYTGSIDLVPGTITQKVNTLLWTVDYTYAGTATDPNAWSDLSFFPDVSRNMTIGSDIHNLTQSGLLQVTWYTDYLLFDAGSATSFDVDGYHVDVTLLAVPTASAGGSSSPPWVQPAQDMMAQFTIEEIPEPATWIHDPNTAGNWQDPNNWISNNLPTASDTTLVDNGGTASISSSTGSVQVDSLYVGNQVRGSILQSGGTMTVGGSLTLGYTTGSSGTYTLSGGSLGATNQYVGDSGIGTFSQSGGTNTVGGSLYVGYQNGASGTYNLSGGVMAVGGSVSLGGTISRGLLNITGGSLTATGPIVLASAASSTGELKVAKAAYVEVGGLTINSGSGRSTKVAMELDANGNSLIRTTGAATLAGSLDLQRLGNYRPNQGDTFTLIMATNMSGAFDAITSNVPGLLLLDPNNPGLGYWPAFRSEVDPNADLVAIFQGAMLGDAGGDNKVNEADLGDLVSYWKQPGGTLTWQQGDFGGDGSVNEADLGDLVTNWGQSGLPPSAPPPPEAPAPIPEPASLALLAAGVVAGFLRKDSRRRGFAPQ